jgi:trimeric autotransporter adhesin
MQKSIFTLLVLISILTSHTSRLNAQDNVGIGTLTPNTKAVLDLEANDKGFLAPRLSTANRLNIAPAATEAGLLVFDTDLSVYFYWDGTQWINFPGVGGLNTAFTFDNQTNTLSITDAGGTLSTILNIDVNDADSDPTNEIQTLSLSNNILNLSISNNDIDLTPYVNTDNQTLTLTGNTLDISNGNSVDLSSFANTDNQTLSLSGSTLSISNGNSVNLSSLSGTGSVTNEFCRSGSQAGVIYSLSTQLGVSLTINNAFCALTKDGGGNNGSGERYHVYPDGSGNWVFYYQSGQSGLNVCVRCFKFAP